MVIKVLKYGLLPPIRLGAEVAEQISLAHKYQNTLIQLERQRREERDAVLATFPAVAETLSNIQRLESELEKERAVIIAQRSENRTKNVGDPTTAKALVKQLKEVRKQRNAAVKAAIADAVISGKLNTVSDAHKARVKEARASNGVYWGTYLLIERAVEQAAKAPGPPRFQRWTGEGAVAVQLMAAAGEELQKQSAVTVLSGTNNYARISSTATPVPGRGQADSHPLHRVQIRIGSNGRDPIFAEWPIVLSRPIPNDALIKGVKIQRRRIASHDHWFALFTIAVPEPRELVGLPLAVNLRWSKKLVGDEATTLAADWATPTQTGEVHVNHAVNSQIKKADDLRSIRDQNFAGIKALLANLLKPLTVPAEVAERLKFLHLWQAQGKLAAVVIWWRDN